MVYLPPENFRQVLESLNEQWIEASDYLKSVALGASAELAKPVVASDGNLPKGVYKEFETALVKSALVINLLVSLN